MNYYLRKKKESIARYYFEVSVLEAAVMDDFYQNVSILNFETNDVFSMNRFYNSTNDYLNGFSSICTTSSGDIITLYSGVKLHFIEMGEYQINTYKDVKIKGKLFEIRKFNL